MLHEQNWHNCKLLESLSATHDNVVTLNTAVAGAADLCCSPGSAAVIEPKEGEIDGSVARMGKERHAYACMFSMGRNGVKWPFGKHTRRY